LKLGLHHDETSEESFDFRIFQCIGLALSTIGESEKEETLSILEKRFGLPGRDLTLHPQRLEECLKEILGVSEAAFVIIHILDNIATEFGLEKDELKSMLEALQLARSRLASPTTIASRMKENGAF
jgi:hypothetical protein